MIGTAEMSPELKAYYNKRMKGIIDRYYEELRKMAPLSDKEIEMIKDMINEL